MRVGVSSRGTSWVSMGPLGWLILGPFILSFLLIKYLIIAIAVIVALVVQLVQHARQRRIVSYERAIRENWRDPQ